LFIALNLRKACRFTASPLLLLPLLLTFPPFMRAFLFGQLSPLLLAAALGSLQLREKHHLFSGLTASILFVKPHITFIPLAGWTFHALRAREYHWIAGLLIGLTLQFLLVLTVNGNTTSAFIETVPEIIEGHNRLLSHINVELNTLLQLLAVGLALLALFARSRLSLSHFEVSAILLALGPCISSYLWIHDLLLAFPLFVLCVGRRKTLLLSSLVLLSGLFILQEGFITPSPYEYLGKLGPIILTLLYTTYAIFRQKDPEGNHSFQSAR
ncbi:hypothetical protein MRY87_12855, partial [bacterium]|nr:hypothetical protein [bacterium]